MKFLHRLREANRMRQAEWPGGQHISNEFVAAELAEEGGEACGAAKKLVRHDLGITGNGGQSREALLQKLADELGDVIVNADRLADLYGIDLEKATCDKFNKISVKHRLSTRLLRQ